MSQTTVTFPIPPAFAGMIADTQDIDVLAYVSTEVSAEMPFGVMIAKGTADFDALLPAASNAKLAGVLVHSFTYDNGPNGELGTTGLKPKACLSLLRRGRIYVVVEEAVVALDRAFVRWQASGGNTQLGAWRKSSDSGTAIDLGSRAQFITSASGGAIATVEVDLLNT